MELRNLSNKNMRCNQHERNIDCNHLLLQGLFETCLEIDRNFLDSPRFVSKIFFPNFLELNLI
jgi:hypothetical protein